MLFSTVDIIKIQTPVPLNCLFDSAQGFGKAEFMKSKIFHSLQLSRVEFILLIIIV